MRKAIRAGQNLDEAIAATPLGQQYTQDIAGSDPPLVAQFAAFRAGIHRWNVWRTYQGMNADAARSRAGALTRFAPGEPGARAA